MISILNKNDFNQLMHDNNINADTIEQQENTFFISINDTTGEMSISYFQDVESDNLLKLYFDDTVEDTDTLKMMSDEQSKEIISFLSNINKDDFKLFIHCTAGQNRSGSVGKFAADYLEYDHKKLLQDNPFIKGNSVVTRKLNKTWMWSHYED